MADNKDTQYQERTPIPQTTMLQITIIPTPKAQRINTMLLATRHSPISPLAIMLLILVAIL